MRVLITNNRLDLRGGSESFVRDLARSLNRLGHSAIAYSSDLTQQPRMLENDVLPVTTDIERLPFKPDVIHAQHHLDAMSAIMALPGVPAVFMTHGATWRGVVPLHPRIYRYVTVSRTQTERLAVEQNIDPSRISVYLNGVDRDLFATVRPAPARPRRALIYHGNQREGSPTVQAIREACATCELEVETAGHFFGRRIEAPEALLPQFDVVFAAGRSAIEALASGCAVVIMGRTSCGPLVTPENFDHFQSVNFSIAVNSSPPSAAKIAAELRRYNAGHAAAVTERTRREHDRDVTVLSLVRDYEAAVEEHRRTPADPAAEALASARYLRTIVPLIKQTDIFLEHQWSSHLRASSVEELRTQLTLIQKELEPST